MTQRFTLISDTPTDTPVSALSDDDLMRLASLNRRDAFEALVVRHQAFVFGLAARFLGDRDKGRDVTQDVFLALWSARHRYRPGGLFKSYLTSVCLNRCRVVTRGASRRARREAGLEEEMTVSRPSDPDVPLSVLLENERRREMQDHLTRLPEKCREVMIFRFTHEMPLGEISDVTGMPLGTVKSHLLRGVKRLRQLMTRKKDG